MHLHESKSNLPSLLLRSLTLCAFEDTASAYSEVFRKMEFFGVTSRKREEVILNFNYQNLCDYSPRCHADSPAVEVSDAKWTLRLYFGDKEPVRVHLLCQSASPRTAEWSLFLASASCGRRTGAVGEPMLCLFDSKNPQSPALRLFKRSDCFFTLRELQLRVNLSIFGDEQHELVEFRNYTFLTRPEPVLNLGALLLSTKAADISISCSDETLPAHSLLLTAASDVLAAMITDMDDIDFAETGEGKVIPLNGVRGETMKEALRFIYTNELQIEGNDLQLLRDLLSISQSLQIRGLKEMCSYRSQYLITTENLMSLLLIADEYDHEELRQLVYNFASAHREEIATHEEIFAAINQNTPASRVQLLRALIHGRPVPLPRQTSA